MPNLVKVNWKKIGKNKSINKFGMIKQDFGSKDTA